MSQRIRVAAAVGHLTRSRSLRPFLQRVSLAVLLACFVLLDRSPAGVINGNFQTGDLTGWEANALLPPLSTPAIVDVTTVSGSLVGGVHFSSSLGGHYAGSLSQDFHTGNATKLTFDIGFSVSSPVAPGEPNVVAVMDVFVQDLNSNVAIRTLHIENTPGEPSGAGLVGHSNGLAIHSFVNLPGADTHLRFAMFIDFHTLNGVPSSGQLLVDNVTLVPEPSACALAISATLALASVTLRRRRSGARLQNFPVRDFAGPGYV